MVQVLAGTPPTDEEPPPFRYGECVVRGGTGWGGQDDGSGWGVQSDYQGSTGNGGAADDTDCVGYIRPSYDWRDGSGGSRHYGRYDQRQVVEFTRHTTEET